MGTPDGLDGVYREAFRLSQGCVDFKARSWQGRLLEVRGKSRLERHECGRREADLHFGGSNPIGC
jgi:hypothetical protein